jgi:hypothetical protein
MSFQVDPASFSNYEGLEARQERHARKLLRNDGRFAEHEKWLQKLDDEQEEQREMFTRFEALLDTLEELSKEVKNLRATLSASSSAACCVHCEVAASGERPPVRSPLRDHQQSNKEARDAQDDQ